MSNMTIENIGQFMNSGNLEKITDRATSIESPTSPQAPDPAGASVPTRSFSDFLKDSITENNSVQLDADRAIKELVAGRNKNVHETMLAIEKADMSFRMMMTVRNKVIEAYREIMRMQV